MIHALLIAGANSVFMPPAPPEPPTFYPTREQAWEAIALEECTPKAPQQSVIYPETLIGTNTTGTTVLILAVNPCGEVRDVIVEVSSKNRDIDLAALRNARTWVIDPVLAKLPSGHGGRVRVPVLIAPSAPIDNAP